MDSASGRESERNDGFGKKFRKRGEEFSSLLAGLNEWKYPKSVCCSTKPTMNVGGLQNYPQATPVSVFISLQVLFSHERKKEAGILRDFNETNRT
jgi:hypothetical protein